MAGLAALRDRPDRTGELAAIRCPTLVIGGARDQVVPIDEMRGMSAAIPKARFVALDGIGHLANLEAQAAFDGALGAFLGEQRAVAR
jgi:pimeloyl-ACP methyl ester carboxylesterase